MSRHRLRREIIATVLANEMVNLCGPTFPGRLTAAAGCDAAALVAAFEAARQVLRFDEAWARVAGAGRQGPGRRRRPCCSASWSGVLRGQTYWLARRAGAATATGRARP